MRHSQVVSYRISFRRSDQDQLLGRETESQWEDAGISLGRSVEESGEVESGDAFPAFSTDHNKDRTSISLVNTGNFLQKSNQRSLTWLGWRGWSIWRTRRSDSSTSSPGSYCRQNRNWVTSSQITSTTFRIQLCALRCELGEGSGHPGVNLGLHDPVQGWDTCWCRKFAEG